MQTEEKAKRIYSCCYRPFFNVCFDEHPVNELVKNK